MRYQYLDHRLNIVSTSEVEPLNGLKVHLASVWNIELLDLKSFRGKDAFPRHIVALVCGTRLVISVPSLMFDYVISGLGFYRHGSLHDVFGVHKISLKESQSEKYRKNR